MKSLESNILIDKFNLKCNWFLRIKWIKPTFRITLEIVLKNPLLKTRSSAGSNIALLTSLIPVYTR